MTTMSERLKWCRQRYGWTQRDLAAASGLGLATIRRVEQQQFAPRLSTVQRLAETLHVREGWLAFGEEPMVGQTQSMASVPATAASGEGPWYTDGGEWKIDARLVREKGHQA